MSMLDSLFGVQRLFVNGAELITRKAANLTGWVSGADNATAGRSEILVMPPTATAVPSTGSHVRGEIVLHSAPSAGGFVGWVCTASGTPGTWKTFGAITA